MNDDQLVIEIGAKLTDFQKSMSDATSSASQAMSKIEARGAEAAKKLDASFGTLGKPTTTFDTLSRGFLKAERDAGQLVTRLKQVNETLSATKASAASGFATGQNSTLSGLAQQIGAAGGLKSFAAMSGGALGVGAIAAGVVAEQTKQLADLQELADKARVTASQMAGLQSVFGKLGMASETTGKMMETFADRLLNAKTSGGELKEALDAAGIAITQADGSLRPTIEVLSDLTKYLRGSSDDATKLKLATAAVGDEFAGQFVSSVKAGNAALDNLQAATNRVGSAITNDLARMAESGMRSLDALWEHMNRLYSRMKEIAGFDLNAQDKANVAEQHVREAWGNIRQLQVASALRDVSPDEMKAAYAQLFDAGKALSSQNPIRVLPGGDPREVAPKPATPAPAATPTTSDDETGSSGHSHSGHGRSAGDDKDDKAAQIIEKLKLELQLAQSTGDAHQKIVDQMKIEEKLREAGVTAASAEGKVIADLVRQTDAATAAEKEHKKALDASKKAADAIGQSLSQGIEGMLLDSKRLSDVFRDLAKQLEHMALQAVLTGNGSFGGLFSSATGTTGGLFGGLAHLLGFATGGEIKGPGSGTSDSILARVSAGEFVVNAKAAQDNLGLLHALNGTGPVPRFASGGQVGALTMPSFASTATSPSHSFKIDAPVTVNANGGTPEQNQDLAAKMQAQMVETMKKTVVGEIAKQMRPGNVLQSVTR